MFKIDDEEEREYRRIRRNKKMKSARKIQEGIIEKNTNMKNLQ